MSVRKKRMIFMVVGVILCCLIVLFLGERAMRSDQEEYARKCKSYEGIWKSKNRDFSLEVHRVSSGTLFFSLNNRKTFQEFRLLAAQAVDDDIYEFSYGVEATGFGRIYEIRPGQEAKGTISLRENEISIDFPKIPGKVKGLEYKGNLSKQGDIPKQSVCHLADYLGTTKKVSQEIAKYCSFGYDDSGKVWRVHAMLDEEGEYYTTDIHGIGMNSSSSECEYRLGDMTSETELIWGGCRRTYENSDYVSTVITNEYGVIVELDCQIANLPGTTRQGDFLMKGDTAYRFAGDYSQGINIDIPKYTKRIASHAFDAGEHCYTLNSSRKYVRRVVLPSTIFVEEYAFANCGPLHISLANGWKEIPRRAFAHMVSLATAEKKGKWVDVEIPASVEKIDEEAFALGESSSKLDKLWAGGASEYNPVTVDASSAMRRGMRYVGDNAFWGIVMTEMPVRAEYLGKNYTFSGENSVRIPDKIKVLKKDSLYLMGFYFDIYIPQGLQDMEDEAIRGCGSCNFYLSEDNLNEEANPCLKESKEYGPRWILSEDGRILYVSARLDYSDDETDEQSRYYYYEDIVKHDSRYQYDGEKMVLTIPEGIEEIRSMANFCNCGKIIFPKSLKKLHIDPLRYCDNAEFVFRGDIPEITGNTEPYLRLFLYLDSEATIKVKKGKKKELLHELMKGEEYNQKQKKIIGSHITTF
ncbi:MAG: leucine-rich repeat domain-containing protein [Eubacterium sp.]|nr:leucine-rich repeat domain-containing protein [Eubacterium sp.]